MRVKLAAVIDGFSEDDSSVMHLRIPEARAYLTLATHFLRLAEGASAQLVRRKNALAVISDKKVTPAQYARKTGWSDHAVGIAILFNLYHCIELVLKGCLAIRAEPPNSHKLSELLTELKKSGLCPTLAATIAKFVRHIDGTSPLGRFLAANGIAIDSWYESLKYPKSRKGKPFTHIKLKYGGLSTVAFWRAVGQGAASLRKQSVAFLREAEGA